MKILKLIGVFIVLGGIIFFALNWNSIFTVSSINSGDKEYRIEVQEKCDEIRKAWSEQSTWSEQLYSTQKDDIDQSKAMGLFSDDDYEIVHNCLREEATDKACRGYHDALNATPFVSTKLDSAYTSVKTIKELEKLDNNERVKEIAEIHSLYLQIINFANRGQTVSTKFNSDTKSWTSFESQCENIHGKADTYRNARRFDAIKHIESISQAVDHSSIQDILNGQVVNFYSSLKGQIIDYFNSLELTPENLKLMERISGDFANEIKLLKSHSYELNEINKDLRRAYYQRKDEAQKNSK